MQEVQSASKVKRLTEYDSLDQLLSDYGVVSKGSEQSTTARLFTGVVAEDRRFTSTCPSGWSEQSIQVDNTLKTHLRGCGIRPEVADFYAALGAWMGTEIEDLAKVKVSDGRWFKMAKTDESKMGRQNTHQAMQALLSACKTHEHLAVVAEQLVLQSFVFGMDAWLSSMFVMFVSMFQQSWGTPIESTKKLAEWMNNTVVSFLRRDMGVSHQDSAVAASLVLTSLCSTKESILHRSFGLALCTLQIPLRVLKSEQNEFLQIIFHLLDDHEHLLLACFFFLGIHSGTDTVHVGRTNSRENNNYAYQNISSCCHVTEDVVKQQGAWENTEQLTHVYDTLLSCFEKGSDRTLHQILFHAVENSPSWAFSKVVPNGHSSSLETILEHMGVVLCSPSELHDCFLQELQLECQLFGWSSKSKTSFDLPNSSVADQTLVKALVKKNCNVHVAHFMSSLLKVTGYVEHDMQTFYLSQINVPPNQVSTKVAEETMLHYKYWPKEYTALFRDLCVHATNVFNAAVGLHGHKIIDDLLAQLFNLACHPKLCERLEFALQTAQCVFHKAITAASHSDAKSFKAGLGWALYFLNGIQAHQRDDQLFPSCDLRTTRSVVTMFSMHFAMPSTHCIIHENFRTTLSTMLIERLQMEFDVLRRWHQPHPANAVVHRLLEGGFVPLFMHTLRCIAGSMPSTRNPHGIAARYAYATLSKSDRTMETDAQWTTANKLKKANLECSPFTFSHVVDHTAEFVRTEGRADLELNPQWYGQPFAKTYGQASPFEIKNRQLFEKTSHSSSFGTRAIEPDFERQRAAQLRATTQRANDYKQMQSTQQIADATAVADALIADEAAEAAQRAEMRAKDAAKRDANKRLNQQNKAARAAELAKAKASECEKHEAQKAKAREEAQKNSNAQKQRKEDDRKAAFKRAEQAKTKADQLKAKVDRGVAARAVEEAAIAQANKHERAKANADALMRALVESEAAAANATATAAREAQELEEAIARSLNVHSGRGGGRRAGRGGSGRGGRGKPASPPPPPPPTDDETMCVVCLDDVRAMVVVPCGHRCLCASCGAKPPAQCPLCRGPATSVIRVFG